VTLNDLEGHSPVAGLFKCNPSNIFATLYTISTDSVLARFLCVSRASCSCDGLSLVYHSQYHHQNESDNNDNVSALYDDADDVKLSSSSTTPWLRATAHPPTSSVRQQLSPHSQPTLAAGQPLPAGWIISPQPHQQQQQQQPSTESLHVVHNMSGILAFFDKSVSIRTASIVVCWCASRHYYYCYYYY